MKIPALVVKSRRNTLQVIAVIFVLFICRAAQSMAVESEPPLRTLIIKTDDFWGPSERWDRFLDISRKAGVKVAIGVVAESLASENTPNAKWAKEQQAKGDVEFWNHGYDHKLWEVNGAKVSEFSGSGFDHQQEHFSKAQSVMAAQLGAEPLGIGTPFNGFDDDTARVLNASPAIRVVLTNNPNVKGRLNSRIMVLPVLSGDTSGHASLLDFKAIFDKLTPTSFSSVVPNTDVVAIQFHPNSWKQEKDVFFDEYAQLLEYWKLNGWKVVLPREYVAGKDINK